MPERPLHATRELDPTPVKHTWFRGHFDGNLYFPQKMRAIRVFEAAEVIADPPNDFQELRNSRLSQTQVEAIEEEMNKVHLANKIFKHTRDSEEYKELKAHFPKVSDRSVVVGPERIPDLWVSGANGVLRMIRQVTNNGSPLPAYEEINQGPVHLISEEEVEEINKFWHAPKNKHKVLMMQESAEFVSGLLHGTRGVESPTQDFVRDLSQLWLTALSRKDQRDKKIVGFMQDEVARKVIARLHSSTKRYESTAIVNFLDEIDKLGITPTETNSEKDYIYQLLSEGIKMELKEEQLPLPFGMEYEKTTRAVSFS